nr:hypothetical protein [Mycobacterium tilburgii]
MSVSDVVALPFRVGSAVRGRRLFHPVGVLAQGRAERSAPAQRGLPLPSGDVVVRVSKAVGTPGSLPDFIGLAIRIDAAQSSCATPWNILLVAAGSGVLTWALALRPVTSWTGQTLSNRRPSHHLAENPGVFRIADRLRGIGIHRSGQRDIPQGVVIHFDDIVDADTTTATGARCRGGHPVRRRTAVVAALACPRAGTAGCRCESAPPARRLWAAGAVAASQDLDDDVGEKPVAACTGLGEDSSPRS